MFGDKQESFYFSLSLPGSQASEFLLSTGGPGQKPEGSDPAAWSRVTAVDYGVVIVNVLSHVPARVSAQAPRLKLSRSDHSP